MTPITNIKVSDQKAKQPVGTAQSGQYLHASGHPSQALILDIQFQAGKNVEKGKLYAIAATGMPTTMNMQYDHSQHTTDGTLYVFYEVQ
jgi:hypothetical protein